jgi:acetate---CoA ligase (ADP-forming)
MLEARSVAVVGASAREGSVGWQAVRQLVVGRYEGPIHAVNPNYREVLGVPCVPSLEDLPGPVDLVILAVANARLEEQLRAAAKAGARGAVIFASAHEETPPGAVPLTDRLAEYARDAGIVICGANCMGFLNLEVRVRALGFEEREDLEPGGIAWISHSGSAFTALLHTDRGLRFNVAVSAGQELTTTVADYMEYALERPSTRSIALFVETVRDPTAFVRALAGAQERDIPVVALKVGREEAARPLIAAHSGALAGEDGAYEAVFETYAVARVATMDEMADTLELVASRRRAPHGGLAAIHDSGGERAHLIDAAADQGVPLARISEDTSARLADVLEPGLPPVNPLDAWGTGHDFERIFVECSQALLGDPDAAALAFVVDLAGEDLQAGYVDVAERVWTETEKPMAVLSNLSSAIDQDAARRLRSAGVPVLESTATGLAAFRHLFEYRDRRALPPVERPVPSSGRLREHWVVRLSEGRPLSEAEALSLIEAYGVPVVPARRASDLGSALRAAEEVGWPVALKTAAPSAGHKSDLAGVHLGLGGPVPFEAAYRDLVERLGPEVTVAAMAPRGVELSLGVVRDPQFGPLCMVGAGGVLIEVLRDRRFALPPLDRARARRLIDRLSIRPLLNGVRGAPPADVDAVAEALVALSALALDLGDAIDALDVNPLIAGPDGCVAVDALVVPRSKGESASPS